MYTSMTCMGATNVELGGGGVRAPQRVCITESRDDAPVFYLEAPIIFISYAEGAMPDGWLLLNIDNIT